MTVAIIVAHPDDETLGMGGTIARLNGVALLALGSGVGSRAVEDATQATEAERIRVVAFGRAIDTLAICDNNITFMSLPDNCFDAVSLLNIIKLIEEWLDEVRPDAIYTHSPADLNIDHRLTFQAVLTATRPMPGQTVKELYSFEVPSSTEWAFGQFGQFKPNVFVDITETIETKIKAMKCYESEMRPFPHPRSEEALRAIARRWGSVAGVEYAEAFELVRTIR